MAPRADFQYSQLKQPNSFRLLRVQDADLVSDQLRCVLEHFVLAEDRHPEYAAISYCWGDPKNTEDVVINGGKAVVTVNLAAALRQLRKDGQADELYLWADALCINQADVREKAKQIRLMPKIYAGAGKVVTWLSQDERDADHLANLSAVLLKNPNRRRDQTAFLRALNALSTKDYWTRIWIVQELCLAKSIEIACKNQRIPWSKFVQVACGHMGMPLSPGSSGIAAILSDSRILELETIRQDVQNQVPMPIIRALYRTRACQSTIKADRIFALLGLTSDGHTKMERLKYEDQIALTLLNLTLAEMEETGRIDMITFPDRRDTASYTYRTWAPNWINRAFWRKLRVWQLHQVLLHRGEYFRATRAVAKVKFDYKKADLKVFGYSLGTVCPFSRAIRLKYQSPSSLSAAADNLLTEFPDSPGNEVFNWTINADTLHAHASASSSARDEGYAANSNMIAVRTTGSSLYRSKLQSLIDALEPLALRRRVSSNDWLVFQDSADEGDGASVADGKGDDGGPGTRAWVKRDPARFRSSDDRYADELRMLLYLGSSYTQSAAGLGSPSGPTGPKLGGGGGGGGGGNGDLCLSEMRFMGTTRGLVGLGHNAAKEGDHVYLVEGCSVPVLLRERKGAAGMFEVVGECLVLGLMKGEYFDKRKGSGLLASGFKANEKEVLQLI